MKKLTPLFLSAAALVALSPEVANAQGNPVDPGGHINNSGDQADRTEERPQIVRPETPSTDEVETVEAVTTEDQLAEVKELREQDVTDAVLDESSVEVDQVYHTPVQDGSEYQYEEHANTGEQLDDRNKNEVHTRFTVNDQSKLVNKQGEDGASDRETLGEVDYEVEDANDIVGASNFKLVNRGESGPKTIVLSNHDLITYYDVDEKEEEDGTFNYKFNLKFRIPNNSISTVYDLVGTFIDENNNTIDRVISAINVVHQDDLVEIRDERTDPDVEAYKPKNETVPFQRVIKYVQHDEPAYVVTTATGDYEVGQVVVPSSEEGLPSVGSTGVVTVGEGENAVEVNVKAYELNLGERMIIRNGVNGERTVYYKQEFVNEQAVTDVIVDPFRTVAPEDAEGLINEILLVGSVITKVDRVSGVDRFQNAVQLSRLGWDVPAEADEDYAEKLAQLQNEWGRYGSHVFVANADRYADSLTGTPLAAANGAPILLTRGNTLNGAVADELQRLYKLSQTHTDESGQTNFGVTVLGGINSISNDVATAITTALSNVNNDEIGTPYNATAFEVDRIGGIDRYHQAFLVAEEIARINEEENEEGADTDAIYIASGDTFSDALAIAAQAGEYRNPVLLTRGNTLNEYARRFLEEHIGEDDGTILLEDVHSANVTIVGGTSTISQAVANQINEILADKVAKAARNEGSQDFAGGEVNQDYYTNPLDFTPKPVTVDRIDGANRYAVSRNVNNGAQYTVNELDTDFSDQTPAAYDHYLVVSGDHPSDALPASALANQLGYGVLLVSNNTQRAQEQLIAAIENGVKDFTFIGGVNTLSDATFNIFNYTGDTIRAIIDGPGHFNSVIIDQFEDNDDLLEDLVDEDSAV